MSKKKQQKFKPGIYGNISIEDYHRSPDLIEYLSRSDIAHLLKSPAHFRAYKSQPQKESPDLTFGSAAHEYIIQGIATSYAVAPKEITSRRGKAWEEVVNINAGLSVILCEEAKILEEMKKVFDKHKYAQALISGNYKTEITFLWDDNMYEGVKCKCRTDIWRPEEKIIVDYKTTRSAWPSEFARSAVNYDYDLQAAHYLKGVEQSLDEKGYLFYFIAQEKEPPYAIQIFKAGEDFIKLGKVKRNWALNNYWWAIENKNWDRSYEEQVWTIEPPVYALKEYNI